MRHFSQSFLVSLKVYICSLAWITNPKNSILILPSEVHKPDHLSPPTQPAHPITYVYMNLLLQLNSWASVAQLVRSSAALNRRVVGSIPTRGPCAEFFAVVPG